MNKKIAIKIAIVISTLAIETIAVFGTFYIGQITDILSENRFADSIGGAVGGSWIRFSIWLIASLVVISAAFKAAEFVADKLENKLVELKR